MKNYQSFKDFVTIDYSTSMKNTPYMVKQNTDDFKEIRNWRFSTQEECLLAIALYLATPDDMFNINDFNRLFKYTLRMVGNTSSVWSH